MKTIERAHLPSKLWEKVRLPKNYQKALEMLDDNLEFWGKFQRHKCKQRLTKLHQMIIRQRKLRKLIAKISSESMKMLTFLTFSMHTQEKLVVINKKYEKREANREKAAEKAAMVDRAIEKELVQRLKSGTFYPQEIYNLNQEEFKEVLDKNEVTEYEIDVEEEEEEENEEEYEYDSELDEDELRMLEDEEENDEDLEDMGESKHDFKNGEQGGKSGKSSDKQAGQKRPRVRINYEDEDEDNLEYEYEDETITKKKDLIKASVAGGSGKNQANKRQKTGKVGGSSGGGVDF